MKRKAFLKNVASNWVHLVWGVFLGLVMTPLFIKFLGKGNYGIWLLIHSLVGYYGLLDLGVRSAVVRYVSRDLALKDIRMANETLNTAFALYTGTGIAALVISALLALILPNVEGFAAAKHPDTPMLIILVGASLAVSFPGRLLEGVLSAAERFDLSNILGITFATIRNLFFLIALLSGGGLVAMAWVLLVVTGVEKICVAGVVLRKVPGIRISFRMARRHRIREIFNYGIHTFLAQAGDRLRLYTDSIVIASFMPPQAITIFNIGNRPLQYLSRLVLGVTRVLTPAFSRTDTIGGKAKLQRLLILGTRGTTLLSAWTCLLLAISGNRLFRLWVGEGFEESGFVLLLLLPAYLFSSSQTPIASILYGTSRHKFLSRLTLVEGVVNLGLSLWWVQTWGLYGVALGTAVPMLIVRFFILPVYACRLIDLPFAHYLRRGLGVGILPLTGAGIFSLFLMKWIPGGDLLSVLALDGIVSFVFISLTFITLLATGDEMLPDRMKPRFLDRWLPRGTRSSGKDASPPRILFIAYRFPPQGGGGVQRSAKTVKYWMRQGIPIALLSAASKGVSLEDSSLLEEIPKDLMREEAPDPSLWPHIRRLRQQWKPARKIPFINRILVGIQWLSHFLSFPDSYAGWGLTGFWRGWSLCRRFRPDLILVTGPPWTPLIVGWLLSTISGRPLVIDYRDPWTKTYLPRTPKGLSRWMNPTLERKLLSHASGVVAAHRAVLRQLDPILPKSIPRLWVPNGYDCDDFPAITASNGDSSQFTLTYTGGFFSWRNPRTLFTVLEDLLKEGKIDPARFRLCLAGSVEPALSHLSPGGYLAGRIDAKGYLPHRVSVGLLRKSTVNLVLEGELGGVNHHTPGKFYEVLAAERPVLLLCPPGTTTHLAGRSDGCHIAHPDDAVAIRNCLLNLYNDWIRGDLLRGPRREDFRFYDREHQARRWIRFLGTILP
ncbi:MAG: oligosaccharide flippase family protein [Candidatus Eisenbacteria bacterium]|uniref:Oligosaccharide flippase family protein n=1 Tax=Eiseniibacteriota bacterium TaxID=2212470 RepID=A0A948RZJ1_UNCEI|nr:oligosaccharide flippase family protein [Candidatus Eisenbacteria bacterium]MBU1950482.1 oligosaccharide flippase family protein [Candidatus Eisenbacteria bacterium]MBU2692533.1 oligosaccharide flippase family protein [Candidatus Eisenbacteria bacterium]